MLLKCFAGNQMVIQVGKDERQMTEKTVHKALESLGGVG